MYRWIPRTCSSIHVYLRVRHCLQGCLEPASEYLVTSGFVKVSKVVYTLLQYICLPQGPSLSPRFPCLVPTPVYMFTSGSVIVSKVSLPRTLLQYKCLPRGPSLSPRFPCLEPAPVSSQLDACATIQP